MLSKGFLLLIFISFIGATTFLLETKGKEIRNLRAEYWLDQYQIILTNERYQIILTNETPLPGSEENHLGQDYAGRSHVEY